MKPRRPIKRGQPPRRKKPLSRSGKRLVRRVVQRIKSKGKPRFKNDRDFAMPVYVRGLPCATGCWNRLCRHDERPCAGPTEATHVKSRGAGGVERQNLLPLCAAHHREQHIVGVKTFSVKYWGAPERAAQLAVSYTEQYDRAVALGWVPGETG